MEELLIIRETLLVSTLVSPNKGGQIERSVDIALQKEWLSPTHGIHYWSILAFDHPAL